MSKLIPGNQKHLTLEDRRYIERSLNEGKSFKDIAKFLCKDPTTISKEVKLHRTTNTWNKGSFNNHVSYTDKGGKIVCQLKQSKNSFGLQICISSEVRKYQKNHPVSWTRGGSF